MGDFGKEELLFELEDYIKTIWASLPTPVAYVNIAGTILESNDLFIKALNKEKMVVIGQSINKVSKLLNDIHKQTIKKGDVKSKEVIIENKPYLISTKSHTNDKGEKIGYFLTLFDIKALKEAEEKIIKTKEEYERIFNNSSDIIINTDLKGKITNINEAVTRILGFKKEKIIGKNATKLPFIDKKSLIKIGKEITLLVTGQKRKPFEIITKTKKGKEKIGEVTPSIIKEKGEIIGMQAIIRDVTFKKQEEEVKMMKLKDQFLMRVSHELRHPLVPIAGYAQVMLDENPSDIQRKYLQKILSNTNQLKELINKILSVTSFETGEAIINYQKIKIKKLIERIIDQYNTRIELKGIKLISKLKGNPTIKADEIKIKEVITNILDNAYKYTDKGIIKVSLSENNKEVIIKVKDTGKGMTKEKQKNLNFINLEDDDYSEMYKGLGLGLIIIQFIIKAHKGKIKIKSKPGKGTEFIIKLPKKVK